MMPRLISTFDLSASQSFCSSLLHNIIHFPYPVQSWRFTKSCLTWATYVPVVVQGCVAGRGGGGGGGQKRKGGEPLKRGEPLLDARTNRPRARESACGLEGGPTTRNRGREIAAGGEGADGQPAGEGVWREDQCSNLPILSRISSGRET